MTTRPIVDIDLSAITYNYRLLQSRTKAMCGAAVKANAYGLGMTRVAPTLYEAGCRTFFVAHLEEGIELRKTLPDANIYILHGFLKGQEKAFLEYSLFPVLNHLDELKRWQGKCAIHFDTGMNRLGLDATEQQILINSPDLLKNLTPLYLSHFACADEPDHALNAIQIERFKKLLAQLPKAPASMCNSSGLFLDPDCHFDIARPGIALYGGNPTPHLPNPMKQVIHPKVKILQTRDIQAGETIGYGATFKASAPMRTATLSLGYADGFFRNLGNQSFLWLGTTPLPLVGRVSMDLCAVDITSAPHLNVGDHVHLLSSTFTLENWAKQAGTIHYELLTNLGQRYQRNYVS